VGGKSDWFLPSLNELNELCKFARNQTTGVEATLCTSGGTLRGGFSTSPAGGGLTGDYYSSSEYDFNTAWYIVLNNAYQWHIYNKGYTQYVIPVRAFSPASAVAITTQPVGNTSGSALATQPVVRIVDASGNTVTTSTASVTVTASGGTLGGTTTVSADAGVASFTNLTHTSEGSYTLTFTSTSPTTLTPITSTSFTTAATCAEGGLCTVGVSTGAGGGIVFYYSATAFTSTGSACGTNCHYLEAAPTTGSSAWTDITRTWVTNTNSNQTTAVSGADGTAIGTGYQNTSDIVAQSGNVAATSAAVEARAYRGPNNLSDWFLPSKDELNELCKYAKNTGQASGGGTICAGGSAASLRGFLTSDYWGSSEIDNGFAWFHGLYGFQDGAAKNLSLYVRPVRVG
jgi:hypothetical protein